MRKKGEIFVSSLDVGVCKYMRIVRGERCHHHDVGVCKDMNKEMCHDDVGVCVSI